jgi:hypothetical protein
MTSAKKSIFNLYFEDIFNVKISFNRSLYNNKKIIK